MKYSYLLHYYQDMNVAKVENFYYLVHSLTSIDIQCPCAFIDHIITNQFGNSNIITTQSLDRDNNKNTYDIIIKLYTFLEVASDRIEMHRNIAQQRNNWNTLLLNSINMITLTFTITFNLLNHLIIITVNSNF